MKQRLFALIAMAVMISCNDTKVAGSEDHKDGDNMASKNTEDIKEVYHAIETGDVSKLDSLIAEDVVDHNANPDRSDMKGRENVKKMLGEIHTYFENLKVEYINDATSADGSYQYALVRMTGKAKANPWGMPVGMEMDETNVDVIKIKDGKATEHWGFRSMKDIQEMQSGNKPPEVIKDSVNKK